MSTHPMHGASRRKPGVFATNANGGPTMTGAPADIAARLPGSRASVLPILRNSGLRQ